MNYDFPNTIFMIIEGEVAVPGKRILLQRKATVGEEELLRPGNLSLRGEVSSVSFVTTHLFNFEGRGGFEQRGRGRGGRGRGGHLDRNQERPNVDLVEEKAMGKNSAIEETKAMMAKMRLEEKQMANKFRKEKGLPELDENEKSREFRPRERRGRDDRKDGARGQRGGRGRGRGAMPPPGPVPIPPQMMGGMGGMGQMGGMGPFVPGDFRTPPFPGLEGESLNTEIFRVIINNS